MVLYFNKPIFSSLPHPATSYEEALTKFATLEQEEAALPLSPAGHSRLFHHGSKTERVVVLLHGLSSCPEQEVALGQMLFDAGANVIIPRAKYAGFADVLTTEQGKQSGQDLLDQAAIGLDIATGLGNKTTLIGISASALAAAWMAQHRTDIDTVLLIAPFFAPYGYSTFKTNLIANLLIHLPSIFLWKDPHLKAAGDAEQGADGAQQRSVYANTRAASTDATQRCASAVGLCKNSNSYNYPRWSTYTLASTLQLARNVASWKEPLQCNELSFLVSDNDQIVNYHLTKKIVKRWKRENPDKIFYYAFPKVLQIPHNCLNQENKDFPLDLVYSQILKMVHFYSVLN